MFRRRFCTFFAAFSAIPFLAPAPAPAKEKFNPEPEPGDAQFGWYDTAKFHARNETYWRERALCAERDLEQREGAIKKALAKTEGHVSWHNALDEVHTILHDAHRPHSHEHCLNGSHREI